MGKINVFASGGKGGVGKSLPASQEVLVIHNGVLKFAPIGDLEEAEGSLHTVSFDGELKSKISKIAALVKHDATEKIYEIKTRTGRRVQVTGDHSVFTLKGLEVVPVETRGLAPSDYIAIPRNMPYGFHDIAEINLLELLKGNPGVRADISPFYAAVVKRLGYDRIEEILGIQKEYLYKIYSDYARPGKPRGVPIDKFAELLSEADIDFDPGDIRVTGGYWSSSLPCVILVDEDFVRFLGYFVAEGNFQDPNTLKITNSNEKIIEDIKSICSGLFDLEASVFERFYMGWRKVDVTIYSKSLILLLQALGMEDGAGNKRVPPLMFGLSKEKIASFLRGYFSGDGSFYDHHIDAVTKIKGLANDLLYLLLVFCIVARVKEKVVSGNTYHRILITSTPMLKKFVDEIGFVQEEKNQRVRDYLRDRANPNLDVVPNVVDVFEDVHLDYRWRRKNFHPTVKQHYKSIRNMGRDALAKLARSTDNDKALLLAESDIFWDKIEEIRELDYHHPHVYDLSCNPTENFLGGFGGIFLHNSIIATSVAYAASEMTDKKVILVCGDPNTASAETLVPASSLPRVGWVEYLNNPLYYFRDIVAASEARGNLLVIQSKRGRVFYSGGIPEVMAPRIEALRTIWEKDPEIALVVIDAMAGNPRDLVIYTIAFDFYLVVNPSELDLEAVQGFIRDVEALKKEEGWMVTAVNGIVANRVAQWSIWSRVSDCSHLKWIPLLGWLIGWLAGKLATLAVNSDVRKIEERLGMRCVATVPERWAVVEAEERRIPVTRYKPEDRAAQAMRKIAEMLLEKAGETEAAAQASPASASASATASTPASAAVAPSMT